MAEHRNARIGLNVAHQIVPAARNHQINHIIKLEEFADFGALLNVCDQRFRNRVRAQGGANIFDDYACCSFHLAAGLENYGVCGFDGQCSDLRDRVGARLKNHREETERTTYLFEFEAFVEFDAVEHASNGIGQSNYSAHPFDQRLKLLRGKLQAIDQSFR